MRRALILSLLLAVGSLAIAGQWTKTQPNPVQSFTRTSVAYDSLGQHAANTPRQATVALVSSSDGAIRLGESAPATAKLILHADAVDKSTSPATVGIPVATSHGFTAGMTVRIAATVAYNGDFLVVSATTNEIVITHAYAVEHFAGTETAARLYCIMPKGSSGGYLYGLTEVASRLYKSADGVTWDTTGLYSVALSGGLKILADGTMLGFVAPGTFSSIGSCTIATDGGTPALALLTKTGAFTTTLISGAGGVAYFNFSAGYTNGWYKVIRVSDNTATLTTMADVAVELAAGTNTVSFQYGSAVSSSSGTLIEKASTFYTTGQAVYCSFSENASGSTVHYADGYYKVRSVNTTTGTNAYLQSTANPAVDIPFTDTERVAFVLCAAVLTSTDSGATFSVSHFLPSMKMTTYPAISPYVNTFQDGFHQNGNTLILCEYGTAGTELAGRYLHRSTDKGRTWTAVDDLDAVSPKGHHWHAVGYHSGVGAYSRWIAGYGDGSTVTAIRVSDDDGLTWSLLRGAGDSPVQPIAFLDTGDPTRILAGDDAPASVYWIDLSTGYVQSAFDSTDHQNNRFYFFTIHYYNGVYYAGGFDNSGSSPAPCLFVSTDLANWSAYHKFLAADAYTGFTPGFGGVAGGKLHYTIDSSRHFAISPARVENIKGTLITGATTNLLDSADKSSFETGVTNLTSATLTISQAATPWTGTYSAKAVLAGTTASAGNRIKSAAVTLTSGSKYVIQCRMKSVKPVRAELRLYNNDTEVANFRSFFVVDSTWRQFVSTPITANASASTFNASIMIDKLTEPLEVYIDALQVAALPVGEFALGGTAKTADILTSTVNAPYEWTDLFAVQTLGLHTHYAPASGDLFIRSWKLDSDDYLELFWDVSESKFTLKRTIAGSAETVSASAAQEWHPNQVIKFALRVNSAGVVLDIQNGRAVERITDGAMASLLNAAITINIGDNASANQFPGRYLDASMDLPGELGFGFIPFKLTDADVAAAFNLAPTVVAQ